MPERWNTKTGNTKLLKPGTHKKFETLDFFFPIIKTRNAPKSLYFEILELNTHKNSGTLLSIKRPTMGTKKSVSKAVGRTDGAITSQRSDNLFYLEEAPSVSSVPRTEIDTKYIIIIISLAGKYRQKFYHRKINDDCKI